MIDRAKSLVSAGSMLFGSVIATEMSAHDLAMILQGIASIMVIIAGLIAPARQRELEDRTVQRAVLASEAARIEDAKTRRKPRKISIPVAVEQPTNQPT